MYCPNCAACHGQLTTLLVFLLESVTPFLFGTTSTPSFSFAALSSFCSTQLLYLLITAQHCCEAILFDRLVIFFFFFFEKPTSKLRDLGMKSCRAVQHYTYNTFLLLYFYFFNKKIYYFCSVDLMLFTQYINNNSVVYIRILDYLFII